MVSNWEEEYFVKKLKEELQILEALRNNPNTLDPPSSIINTNDYWYLFHKFYNTGTLYTYLNKHIDNQDVPKEEEIAYILKSILIALRDMHALNVAHSDLKA